MMRRTFIAALELALLAAAAPPDAPIAPTAMQAMLGTGFDVRWAEFNEDIATYTPAKPQLVAAEGFTNARIRVGFDWGEAGGTPEHLDRVISDTLAAGLVPILAYKADAFKDRPQSDDELGKFVAWWAAAAARYADVSHKLVFDIIVEPARGLGQDPDRINAAYQLAAAKIRETNPTRILSFAPAHIASALYLEDLVLPKEAGEYAMVEVHTYAAGPNASASSKKYWTGNGTAAQRRYLHEFMDAAIAWQASPAGAPLWFGAWMTNNFQHGNTFTTAESLAFVEFFCGEVVGRGLPWSINTFLIFYGYDGKVVEDLRPVLDAIKSDKCRTPSTLQRAAGFAAPAAFTPFRDAARGLRTTVGAATPANLLTDVSYTTLLAKNYNLVTAENECKWSATEPQRGRFTYTLCEKVRDFAQQHNMTFRGHNLCWGQYNPGWLEGLPADDKRAALENHITNVVRHFGSDVAAWDVVNEAVSDYLPNPPADNPYTLKNSTWYPAVPDFVTVAFRAARAAAPRGVKLFYNDYNIANGGSPKARRVYAMVQALAAEELIDGVGVQAHVSRGWEVGNLNGLRKTFEQYRALGLEVQITEMDVKNAAPVDDAAQAATYRAVLQACLDNRDVCTNFETWGFTDAHTWIGLAQHPLPFDEDKAPKAAAEAVSEALAGAMR